MNRCKKCGRMVKYRKKGLCLECAPKPFLCRVCGETDPAQFYKSKVFICKECYRNKKINEQLSKGRFTIQIKGDAGFEPFTGYFKTQVDAEKHFRRYFKGDIDYKEESFKLAKKVNGEWRTIKYLRA